MIEVVACDTGMMFYSLICEQTGENRRFERPENVPPRPQNDGCSRPLGPFLFTEKDGPDSSLSGVRHPTPCTRHRIAGAAGRQRHPWSVDTPAGDYIRSLVGN
jgi:hypothetical protein